MGVCLSEDRGSQVRTNSSYVYETLVPLTLLFKSFKSLDNIELTCPERETYILTRESFDF